MRINKVQLVQPLLPFMQSEKTPVVVGIGTSNKSIEAYIAELKQARVKMVVDVRAYPYSRRFPQFNTARLKAALEEAGIGYEWLGETLGNPKNDDGDRTMDGFKAHMKTATYRRGVKKLMEIIEETKGPVALTCAEKLEKDCHRKLIIADAMKRLHSES